MPCLSIVYINENFHFSSRCSNKTYILNHFKLICRQVRFSPWAQNTHTAFPFLSHTPVANVRAILGYNLGRLLYWFKKVQLFGGSFLTMPRRKGKKKRKYLMRLTSGWAKCRDLSILTKIYPFIIVQGCIVFSWLSIGFVSEPDRVIKRRTIEPSVDTFVLSICQSEPHCIILNHSTNKYMTTTKLTKMWYTSVCTPFPPQQLFASI